MPQNIIQYPPAFLEQQWSSREVVKQSYCLRLKCSSFTILQLAFTSWVQRGFNNLGGCNLFIFTKS